MNKMLFVAALVAVNVSMANDLLPRVPNVARKMNTLGVKVTSKSGVLLKRNDAFPVERIVVGIPVEVSTGSVCTKFVGQEDKRVPVIRAVPPFRPEPMNEEFRPTMPRPIMTKLVLEARGSVNPLQEACIAILPMPVATLFTMELYRTSLSAGGSDAKVVSAQVSIGHLEQPYIVSFDPMTEEVTIRAQR